MATGDTFRGFGGVELEIVWDGSRDSPSLLSDYPRQSTLSQISQSAPRKSRAVDPRLPTRRSKLYAQAKREIDRMFKGSK